MGAARGTRTWNSINDDKLFEFAHGISIFRSLHVPLYKDQSIPLTFLFDNFSDATNISIPLPVMSLARVQPCLRNITPYLAFLIIVVSLGPLQFGFHLVIIVESLE